MRPFRRRDEDVPASTRSWWEGRARKRRQRRRSLHGCRRSSMAPPTPRRLCLRFRAALRALRRESGPADGHFNRRADPRRNFRDPHADVLMRGLAGGSFTRRVAERSMARDGKEGRAFVDVVSGRVAGTVCVTSPAMATLKGGLCVGGGNAPHSSKGGILGIVSLKGRGFLKRRAIRIRRSKQKLHRTLHPAQRP